MKSIFFILTNIICFYSFSQNWRMEVQIEGRVHCFNSNFRFSNEIKATFANTITNSVRNNRNQPEVSSLDFVIEETSAAFTGFVGALNVTGGGDCWPIGTGGSPGGGDASGSMNINYGIAEGGVCRSYFSNFSNDTYTLRVNVIIYRLMAIPEKISQDCNSLSITVNSSSSSFLWEYSTDDINYRPLIGKNTQTISVSLGDVMGYNLGTNLYVRVSDPSCPRRRTGRSGSFTLSSPPPNAKFSKVNMSCYGGKDAKINITIIPSVPTLTHFYIKGFYESNTEPDVQISDATGTFFQISRADMLIGNDRIRPGRWKFVIANNQDPHGKCESTFTHNISLERDLEIVEPPELKIIEAIPRNVSCNSQDAGTKDDGSVRLTLQNGVSPYYFSRIENGDDSQLLGTTPDNRYTTTPIILGLKKINYKFVAHYINGSVTCSSRPTGTILIGEPSQRITVSKDLTTDVKCRGGNNGSSISITATGGNSGYSYRWIGPNSFTSTAEDISSIYQGTYYLTVTDFKGCSGTAFSHLVGEPSIGLTVSGTASIKGNYNVSCLGNDGTIDLSYINKNFPISSFEWKRNGVPIFPSNNERLNSLTSGSYVVKVTDANGCSANAAVNLIANPGITGSVVANRNYNGFSTKCKLSDEGTATVSINNGFGTLRYEWKRNNQVIAEANNRTIFDLTEGTYHTKVTDANNCVYEGDVMVTSPTSIKPQLQIPVNGEISCPDSKDGKLMADPINGYGSYRYKWDHNSSILIPLVEGLSKGTYKVTVTDDYGCSASENIQIFDPPKMRFDFIKKNYNGFDLSCFGASDGEVGLKIENGQGKPDLFKYEWSNNARTNRVGSLARGIYNVQVTDAKNCVAVGAVNITGPKELGVEIVHVNNFNGFDLKCRGDQNGELRVKAIGGTGSYTYVWKNGKTLPALSGLAAGSYSVTATDNNGCISSDQTEVIEPTELSIAANLVNPISCFSYANGSVTVKGEGGVTPYVYSENHDIWVTSENFNAVSAGNKYFYVKDANGCELRNQMNIAQPENLQLSFENRIDAICNDPIGSVEVIVTGGNGDYRYAWSNESTNQAMNSESKLVNAIAGIYKVDVVDSKNCSISDRTYISSIGGPTFDLLDINPVTCFGYDDGSASIIMHNANNPYEVTWSDGQSTEYVSKLVAGKYFATVKDGLGCKAVKQITIPTPEPIQSNFISTQPLCFGDRNGSLQSVVSGGTFPYSYKWDNSNNVTDRITDLSAGTYSLNIEDSHKCKIKIQTLLSDPEVLQLDGLVVPPTCLGKCDGVISVFGKGGNGSYNFNWSDGVRASQLDNVCPGEYTVTLTDSNNCQTDQIFNIPYGKPLSVDLGSMATLCVGQTKVLDAGSQWKKVNWTSSLNFRSTDSKIAINEPGSYFFEGIYDSDCVALDTFKLETSLDILKAEFLMEANAAVGDTLVAIDISWPLPEKVEWNYPTSFKLLPSPDDGILYAQLSEPGTFSVGMKSFLAECQDLRQKTISVLSNEPEDASGGRLGYEELIHEFTLSPNPNNGRFIVKIALSDEEEVRLRVIQYPTGVIITEALRKVKEDNIEFNLEDIPQGLYTVLLTVKEQQRFIRFFKE